MERVIPSSTEVNGDRTASKFSTLSGSVYHFRCYFGGLFLSLASKISSGRSWALKPIHFMNPKKSLIFRDFFTCISSSEAQVWVKPNLFFYILFFLTINIELFIPCTETSPVWVLFPSFLPFISFIWVFLWFPGSPFPRYVSCFRIYHVSAPSLCAQLHSLGG